MSLKRVVDRWVLGPVIGVLSGKGREPGSAPSRLKKILIIKLAAAGDAILLKAVVEGFKNKHPDVQIDWLASPINIVLARQAKDVTRFWLLKNFSPFTVYSLVKSLKKERYDAVVDFEQWARGTALIARLSGAPIRAGFDTPGQGRGGAFNRALVKTSADHELYEFFNLMELVGPCDRTIRPVLEETETGRIQFAEAKRRFLNAKIEGPNVLIHPGCGSDGLPREWPVESYTVLCHWLIKNFNARIIISTGPEEIEKGKDLKKLLGGKAVNLGGLLSWEGTLSLVKFADLIISGNTGVMHVAAAMGKKQVALHGPTNPGLWGPLNDQAVVISSPCEKCPCLKLGFEYHDKTQNCMKKIEVSEVKRAVARLIDKKDGI